MDLYELLQGHIAAFLLTLTRISGIFLISPFFGSMNIAPFFRVGIAAAGILSPFTGALWHAASTALVLLNAESLHSAQVREKKFAFSKAL